jgi:hypothetical protein
VPQDSPALYDERADRDSTCGVNAALSVDRNSSSDSSIGFAFVGAEHMDELQAQTASETAQARLLLTIQRSVAESR